MHQIAWGSVADWAQAISSTVVLYLIFLQMRQTNKQMIQQDDSERFSRSWEFVKFYLEQLREHNQTLSFSENSGQLADPSTLKQESEEFKSLVRNFFEPRIHLFTLLNQLLQQQQVDERVLFHYLEEDFNRFVEIGIKISSPEEFRTHMGAKIKLLLTLWGTLIKSNKLLYPSSPARAAAQAAATEAEAAQASETQLD